jgi:hypothetical protein
VIAYSPVELMDGDNLDETIADPLSVVEREALAKLREHEAELSALRDAIAGLRQRSATGAASMAELRRLAKEAERVEGLLDTPKEVLSRDALVEAGWPAADLAQARKVLSAVDDCEAATSAARDQIRTEDGDADDEEPSVLCRALQNLLETWTRLQEAEAEMKTTDLPASKVDLMMEARANAISPLCAALMDKVEGLHTSLQSKAPKEGEAAGEAFSFLQNFIRKLNQDEVMRRALASLQVDCPDLVDAAPAQTMQAVDVSPSRTAGQIAADAAAAVDAAVAALDTDAALQEATTASATLAQTRVASPFAMRSTSQVDDPLLHTIPASKQSETGTAAKSSPGNRAPGSIPNSSGQRYIMPSGSAELWHAVHIGDEAAIRHFVQLGACDGDLRDASGHSVLWHSIAFNHIGIAMFMMDTFPPESDRGVDVSEVHHRKGDTMLHLLCQSKAFGADTAHLFKRIAAAAQEDVLTRVNAAGVTFLQMAAAHLNFWVLTFVFKNFPAAAKALVCMPDHAPLRNMAEAVPQPSTPQYTPSAGFPEHFHIAEMLQQDESGLVPYADVAFDVGPDAGGSEAGRFLAHRIIVASVSPVLMQEVAKLPMVMLPREQVEAVVFRVDPRISKEVWRSILQFMYTGVINFSYTDDVQKNVELLRACVRYKLPQLVLDFAQSCLYPLLPSSSPKVALEVFSICAACSDMDVSSAEHASSYILLRSAHQVFADTEATDACQLLEKIVQSVEKAVFPPQPAAGTVPAHSSQSSTAKLEAANVSAGVPAAMDMTSAGMSNAQQSMHGSPDMMSRSARIPQDMLQQSMQGTADMMQHSARKPQDMLSQSARGPYDMLAQSTRGIPQDARMTSEDMLRHTQDPRMQMMYAQKASMQDPRMQMMQSMQDPRMQMATNSQARDPRMQMMQGSPTQDSRAQMSQAQFTDPRMQMMQSPQSDYAQMMQSSQMPDPRSQMMQRSQMQDPRMQMMQGSQMQDPRMQMMQSSQMQDPRMQMMHSAQMQDPRMQSSQHMWRGMPVNDGGYA